MTDLTKFTPPFRVGRHLKRAVLDSKGLEVVIFPEGAEKLAAKYVDEINGKSKEISTKKALIMNEIAKNAQSTLHSEAFQKAKTFIYKRILQESEKGHFKVSPIILKKLEKDIIKDLEKEGFKVLTRDTIFNDSVELIISWNEQ